MFPLPFFLTEIFGFYSFYSDLGVMDHSYYRQRGGELAGMTVLGAKQVTCGFHLPVSFLEVPSACAAANLSLTYRDSLGKQAKQK